MNEELHICLAAPEHVAALPAVELLAASRFEGYPVPEVVFTRPIALDALEEMRAAGHLWVALVGSGQPVGFIAVSPTGNVVHVRELDVIPSHGGAGIGTRLLQAVEVWATEHGFDEVTLTTFRDIPWNAPFYGRRGYRIVALDDLSTDLAAHLEREASAGFEGRVAMRKRLRAI